MKRFVINWGIYVAAVLGIVFALAVSWFVSTIELRILALEPEVALGIKTTFLALIAALLMFQYGYFENECRMLLERDEKGDYAPGAAELLTQAERGRQLLASEQGEQQKELAAWSVIQKAASAQNQKLLEELKASIQKRGETIEQLRVTIERWDQAVEPYRQWLRDLMPETTFVHGVRLSFLFSVGLTCAISIFLDVIYLLNGQWSGLRFYSQTFFITSVFLFVALIIYFSVIVQSHLRLFSRPPGD